MTGMLKPLSDKIPSYSIFAFDIETVGNTNEFLMGSIATDGTKKAFWDKDEMIDCFMNNYCFRSNARIFATQLYFDFTSLFKDTKHLEWANMLFRGTRMLQAALPNSYKELLFWDTLSFYPFSVKQMGNMIGLPKLDTPTYIKERRVPREDEHAYIEEYNIRDSEITFRFAKFLQESFNRMGCKMKMTIASTAMDLFKRKYLRGIMFQEPLERMKLEYQAYYGGRTEVFKRGLIKDCNYYDFNSLYPSVMVKEYPDVSSSKYRKKGLQEVIDLYEGISEVMVRCPDDLHIPFLPYRQDVKLLFPTGTFKGWYSNVELRKAIELGYDILDIQQQIYYTKKHTPFKGYVEDLYSLRKAKKELGDKSEQVIKLLMNSLYGKFGQKLQGKQSVINIKNLTVKEIEEYAKKGNAMISGDFLYFESAEIGKVSTHIMPIYSIYTTAYGRIKMYDAMRNVDPIYVDTDSIITQEKLMTTGELGDLKLEHEIEEGIIIRPKMYALKTKDGKSIIRVKGNNVSWNWSYDRFKEFIANPKINIETFSTFKMSNKKKISYNTIMPMVKEFGLQDDKRSWPSLFDPLLMQGSDPMKIKN